MQQATDLITSRNKDFPEFLYYIPLIKKAEKDISTHPDICVETCKSLLEGVAKAIILRLDKTASRKDLDGPNQRVDGLVKQAAKMLKKHDNIVEDDFINRCGSFAHSLRLLRNDRGDISHGKAAPKPVESSEHLAKITLQVTDGLLLYLLTEFFRVMDDANIKPISDFVTPPVIYYEDNSDFNEWLDEICEPFKGLLYSQCLFHFKRIDYVNQLEEWKNSTIDTRTYT